MQLRVYSCWQQAKTETPKKIMSLLHYIITKEKLDLDKFKRNVSNITDTKFENRGDNTLYFWVEGKSTRGLDITLENDFIEIRNTILSNNHDYDLTNKVIEIILNLTSGTLINEEEETISKLPIFNAELIKKNEIQDCETIQLLSKENEEITIYGPERKVYFGLKTHEKFKNLEKEKLKEKMFNLIIKANYQLPNFEYGNILQIGETEENKKIAKLLTNKTNYIIDKYDYILFDNSDEQPIMITNNALNKILPTNWSLIDEFTIVAPIIEKENWKQLKINAREFDLWNEFTNN